MRFGYATLEEAIIASRSAAKAAGRVIHAAARGQMIMVTEHVQKERMAICSGTATTPKCEFFTGSTCKKCGCHIRFKAKLQTEHCPIGKW